MFKEELKKYVESSNLVNMKPAGEGIFVLKYKKKVFYDNLWDEYLEHCRGSVIDKDFNLIAYPFQKIYNYGIEKEAPVFSEIDTIVTAFRKVNGFMVAVSYHNGDVLVSTTGSTSGDFVEMAKEMMLKHMPWADWQMALMADDCRDMTFMFECVHRNDPHIVPEQEGMYLLGYRYKSWDSVTETKMISKLAIDFGTIPVEHYRTTMHTLLNKVTTVRHEGFVFYTNDGTSAKIKSPYYLTSKWVARNPKTDKLVNMQADIKKNLDEEYYPLVDAIRANIVEYTAMDEQARLAWVRNYLEE